MAEITKAAAVELAQNGTDEQVNEQLRQLVDVDRRVISRKETIGYMLLNSFNGFHINNHKEHFTVNVLKIGWNLQSYFHIFAGIWDIVDDVLIAGLVEKTRTRWGKFIPYMAMSGLPLAIIALFYWCLPALFGQANVDNTEFLPKFFAWAFLETVFEVFQNFKSVGIGGYMATVTPYPSDRRRLVAISSYASIILSRLPDMIIEFTMDFITNGLVKSVKGNEAAALTKAFMILGPSTMFISGLVITWYSTIAKERVHQKIEVPKLRESLRVVFTNRPLLAKMISDALGSFNTGVSTNDYYRYVLYMTTFETFAGIPSFFFQPIGFSKYNQMAQRFSTKSLYTVSQVFAKAFYIPVWLYGRFFKIGKGKNKGQYFFQNRWAMLPITAVWECIYATFWGIRTISISEMGNECNDYIEWKYGQRNEATLSVAGSLICKIPSRINAVFQPQFKKWIGFDQNKYDLVQPQSFKAQKWLFAFSTIFTTALVFCSMIPMFWYNIDKETRDRMYRELNERRVKTAERINSLNQTNDEPENS